MKAVGGSFQSSRPVPPWLHLLAVVTVVDAALVLVLGGFVTTFRAGMADPVWPTEPWYLAENYKLDFGYLLEHGHRIAAWLLGPLGLVLSFGIWACHPDRGTKWRGILAAIAMIATFGAFHGVARMTTTGQEGPAFYGNIAAMLVTAGAVVVTGLRAGTLWTVISLGMLAAMTQGLLGGLRVKYNDLAGRPMSAVHGTFAVVVFGLLVATAVLTRRPRREPPLPDDVRRRLRWQTTCLVAFTFLQVAWGAWVRHLPGPTANRLHLLFAFVVVGFATLAMKQAYADPAATGRLKPTLRVLMALITVQVVLGIEAWLGKFMTGTLPELERLTTKDWDKALVRTAHAHVGAWILATNVAFALIVRRRAVD